ncbi:MAG: hypothetical protein QS748_06305 [Candidatus Endonucleobacter bathymodioli]|uniref:Uncharacterized protein n=1 Tax=Candidatus Endonucleibacter bathymodioli TaxID=539814 RepID=A0AA90NV38_9GAMM|nr:hypothetical protein [Candidatus Endonucleobacter bathymodioli]
MMLLHRILIQFIFIISTASLFSCNAYGAPNKNIEQKSNSPKIDYNTSQNLSASVKYHITPETCVYNTTNRALITHIIRAKHNKQQLNQLQSFVIKAIKHPTNCLFTHDIDNVIIFLTAASKCKNDSHISILANQLIKGETRSVNDIWNCYDIWNISSAISEYSGSNISDIRQIIATKIVNPNNDMHQWKSYNIIKMLQCLIKGNSKKEAEAFQHIVDHATIRNCAIYNWRGQSLSQLFELLIKKNIANMKMTILKAFSLIVTSGLSHWNAKSSSTMLRDLMILQKTPSADIKNDESYRIVMQLIINRLASPEIRFIDYDGHTLAETMNVLLHTSKLGWPKNIDKARQRLAKFIVDGDINISLMANNDWIMTIRGLTNESMIEQEAMQTIAAHFNDRRLILSQWTSDQLLHIATEFSHNHGQHIEKATQKIASFVTSKNLESWSTVDLAILAQVWSPKTRGIHHKTINNIADQILNKSLQLPIVDYIDLAFAVSLSKGDHCLELIRCITKDVGDDIFDLSRLSPILLAKLVSIVNQDDDKYAKKALSKITNYLISMDTEQWLNLPSDSLKLITNACCKHYKLTAVQSVLHNIFLLVIDDRIDLLDWPIDTLEVLIRTFHKPYHDDLIQRGYRKIVAQLNRPDTALRKWPINTLASVAKGVSNLRDYSSEEFIARLAKIYMEKRDRDETKYGITILLAICHLPIESEKIIKAAVKLSSVLYNTAYSNMDPVDRIYLFWVITLLDFVVHEEGRINTTETTKTVIVELTKIIPRGF